MDKKLKVVLLCHYWSDEVSKVMKCEPRREMAPWIQETINLFKNKNEIELTVVAPNYAYNRDMQYEKNNITFYFYNYALKNIARIILFFVQIFIKYDQKERVAERVANLLTGYQYPKYRLKKIITKLNPDIIHLYGSETPEHAVGVIPLMGKYPLVVSLQGYSYKVKMPSNVLQKIDLYWRKKYEKIINTNAKYIAHFSLEEGFKPFYNNQTFYNTYPITKVPNVIAANIAKEYDVVFYARIQKSKGIEDLIATLSYLKKKSIKLKTLCIGSYIPSYMEYLETLVDRADINDLISFTGFIHTHEDVYKLAAKAKVMVLPSHEDGFNNTIREAMFMKLPIVANNVGGIPIANINKECITLSKLGDIEDLANKILLVLNNKERTAILVNNAYNEVREHYSPQGVYKLTLDMYEQVLNIDSRNNEKI